MSDLLNYFNRNEKRLIHKWLHYFEIYERHFAPYRNQPVTILEIGVSHGGSLQMWKHYFGVDATIVGIDIDQRCKAFEEDQIKIWIGSQEDTAFLHEILEKSPSPSVIIDDGGHTMAQMRTTFKELYPALAQNGTYLVEDLHTCYWKEYGGGFRKTENFLELTKGLIDQLNAWHSRDPNSFFVDAFTETTFGIHFYDSIVVFEKRRRQPPYHEQVGHPSFC